MTCDSWKTATDADFFGSTHPHKIQDDTTPPDFLPGDRVHHRMLGIDATVISNSGDKVLVEYDDDGTFYAVKPAFFDLVPPPPFDCIPFED